MGKFAPICPFCKHDPFEYVDIGVGYEAVAVSCCELGIVLFDWRTTKPAKRWVRRVLRDMRSHHPHAKARAMRVMREAGLKPELVGRAALHQVKE